MEGEASAPLLVLMERGEGDPRKADASWRRSAHRYWSNVGVGAVVEFMREAGRLGSVAAPMVAVIASQFLVQVVSTMMVGHLGELDLAAAAIATSLTNVTGFSLLLGMASGLETVCGQAYGAEQFRMLGIHTYRAIFTLLLVCIPISLLWISLGSLLRLLGQDPLVSEQAGRYATWMIPCLFAYAIAQPLVKFLLSQSLILPMLLSSVITLCLHIPLCWVMVFKSGLGNVGAALSIGISYWLNSLMMGMYIWCSTKCEATRTSISKEAFRGIGAFLKLAVPAALMICLEWWSFEMLILLSGFLPNSQFETSVLSICLNVLSLLYSIPFGIGSAASTRVSNELGAGNPKGALLAVKAAMSVAVSAAILVTGTLMATRRYLGYAFSNEEEVTSYVTEMVPLVCLSVVFEFLQGVLSGIARGCGWQDLGAYVNLGSFYLCGIPIAVVLGFLLHVGAKGLWIGIMCGAATQTLLLSVITSFINWQNQAIMARERILKEALPLHDQDALLSEPAN